MERAAQAKRYERSAEGASARRAFFQGFLRSPRDVGSIVPSSRFLERRLVEEARVAQARVLVELGPGTGGTTRAFLRALSPTSRLLAIELDPLFADGLRRMGDPRLLVHEGSAEALADQLSVHGLLGRVDAVISGIPFSTIPHPVARRIVERIRSVLAPGGRFVAYQVRGHVADVSRPVLGQPAIGIELRNIPPARIYRWQVPAG